MEFIKAKINCFNNSIIYLLNWPYKHYQRENNSIIYVLNWVWQWSNQQRGLRCHAWSIFSCKIFKPIPEDVIARQIDSHLFKQNIIIKHSLMEEKEKKLETYSWYSHCKASIGASPHFSKSLLKRHSQILKWLTIRKVLDYRIYIRGRRWPTCRIIL